MHRYNLTSRNFTAVHMRLEDDFVTSIKTTVLGIDQRQAEYWLFKDDLTRIYIKRKGTEEQVKAFE